MPAYIPGKPSEEVQREYGLTDVVKLASNENPLGPSPAAVVALRRAVETVHLYPESPASDLRAAIARKHGLSPDMVLVSNGGDNVITLIALAFLNPGEEAITCVPTFSAYEHAVQVAGGRPVLLPLRRHAFDLDAIAAAVNGDTKLIFLCNPNNPTGTIVEEADLAAFLRGLPDHVVVVVDEAYAEYAESPRFPDVLGHVRQGRNVIAVRTFSKIYGLAGLRVGYALAPAGLVELMARVREPFPVSRPAQTAALAALSDEVHVARSLQVNRDGKAYLYRELQARGIACVPTEANFVLMDLGRDAQDVFQRMLRLGVIVRPGGIWGLPTCIRVTIGTREQNERFIAALDRALA